MAGEWSDLAGQDQRDPIVFWRVREDFGEIWHGVGRGVEGPVGFDCLAHGLVEVGGGGYGNGFQLILLLDLQLDGAGSLADFEVDNGDLHRLEHA